MTVSSTTAPSFGIAVGHTYNVALAGGGVLLNKGKGGEEDIKAQASFSTFGEWTPADFPGTVKLFEGGVWGGKTVFGKKVGGGKRDAALVLTGRGTHPERIVALEGLGGDYREGIGGEFEVSVGRVFEKGEDLEGKDFSRRTKPIWYAVKKKDKEDVHFDLGSAILKNRVDLRKCAAIWLPWLESPLSALEIVGQADTVEIRKPGRNQELSEMRANNIKQALKDILGDNLKIPDGKIETKGLGDVEAAKHDRPETPDRKFRRVDVNLNGRCVLVLRSA